MKIRSVLAIQLNTANTISGSEQIVRIHGKIVPPLRRTIMLRQRYAGGCTSTTFIYVLLIFKWLLFL